jgi:rRNA maturation endonuclease Nob1
MTVGLPSREELPVLATIVCPQCAVVVPDAHFCGACGANLVHQDLRAAQRLHAYTAFPDEPVLRLSAVTSLFPQLSTRAKAPFRLALSIVLVLILAFALSGAAAPLIALCALGIPLLFLLYIWEVDPYEGSFILPTVACLAVGAGLGVGWAFIGRTYVDQAVLPVFGTGLTGSHALAAGVLVPGIGQLLMCVPMVLVWAWQRSPRESLDGFAAGASGALGFTMAATITLMAPWFSDGQLVHQPFTQNLAQAVLHGISFPLVSAMTTGLVGAAFWATSGGRSTAARGHWLTSTALALGVALAVQIGLGFTDISVLPSAVLVLVHLGAIAASILLVRIGIHHVLLHEAGQVRTGPPTVCTHCNHLVPTMLFCPQCGVAERAQARAHRPRLAPGPEPGADEPSGGAGPDAGDAP